VWVEPLFGEAKDFHRLRRFHLRGLKKVNFEGMMIAARQNLKRLIKHRLEKLYFLTQYLISRLFPRDVSTFSTACIILCNFLQFAYSFLLPPHSIELEAIILTSINYLWLRGVR